MSRPAFQVGSLYRLSPFAGMLFPLLSVFPPLADGPALSTTRRAPVHVPGISFSHLPTPRPGEYSWWSRDVRDYRKRGRVRPQPDLPAFFLCFRSRPTEPFPAYAGLFLFEPTLS